MTLHLRRDLDKLKKDILTMGGMVEEAVRRALRVIWDRDRELGDHVIAGDQAIDLQEVLVEEECLKALALHQPVASDLRFIAGVLKINTDLERMADLAVNIAEHGIFLCSQATIALPRQLETMTEMAVKMTQQSLDAFVNLDAAKARQVLPQDDVVDQLNRDIIQVILESIKADPPVLERLIRLFSVTRHLERIADHATNIAEDVVYMVEGAIIRHQHGQQPRK